MIATETFTQKNPAEAFSANIIEVISPLDGTKLSEVETTSYEEFQNAVKAASDAFHAWSQTPVKERVQVFFRYRELLLQHKEELAKLVHKENGKTMSEAYAEIEKCIELTEFTCSLPQLIQGEILEVSKGVECKTIYAPLGVVASITPFNFPSMVPHWTVPNAIALGNTMILKPSELVPLSAYLMAGLLEEAGLPKGVLNIVNGGKEIVEAICDNPAMKAVSFVGSTPVAKIVYKRATGNYKRALALGGAKNHLIVLPDADPDMTAANIVASMSGCAGQRCMAASVMIAVGEVDHIIEKMCAEAMKVIPGSTLGSVISKAAKERIESYISSADKEGAKILVDGRNAKVVGKKDGFYVGPTIIDHVKPYMKVAQEEIFGPVISIIRVSTIEEALEIENASAYGNAAGVFTRNGGLAKRITEHASAGMIGVNIGVPVPREPFSFAGWNESKFGVGDITGKSSIEFWTQLKKVSTKWNADAFINWMS